NELQAVADLSLKIHALLDVGFELLDDLVDVRRAFVRLDEAPEEREEHGVRGRFALEVSLSALPFPWFVLHASCRSIRAALHPFPSSADSSPVLLERFDLDAKAGQLPAQAQLLRLHGLRRIERPLEELVDHR